MPEELESDWGAPENRPKSGAKFGRSARRKRNRLKGMGLYTCEKFNFPFTRRKSNIRLS
ncbi:hypothetical protein OBV_40830 [Oscillibacter valericigenes Sjm18-20]|nr:hypothetical protein OBV_40830 [Oscillibacter valericigenes Sjm18-20]